MRLVHTCGNPEIVKQLRISERAIAHGLEGLNNNRPVLCDVEMVKHGLTKRFLNVEPLCFLNHDDVPSEAKRDGVTRSMTAVNRWQPHLDGGICIIGNAPTALYRLMEMLAAGAPKPALVIATPVGFVGAAESKDCLWRQHQQLGVECITVAGRAGGSALAAAAFNTLIRLQRGLRF